METNVPISAPKTLRNHIYDDFILRRDKLKYDLEVNCVSISFTLDMWTSPSRKPISAIGLHPTSRRRKKSLNLFGSKESTVGNASLK
jgi:hypothetical protein